MSRDKAETKRRILDAAQGLLAEEGLSGLGVNAIARRAGVGKPLIYRYFSNLNGLVAAMFEDVGNARFLGAPAGDMAVRKSKSAEDAVRALILSGRAMAQDKAACDMTLVALAQGDPGLRKHDEAAVPLLHDSPAAGPDLPAIDAIMRAAMAFIILYRQHNNTWAGLSLERPKDMARLENAMAALLGGAWES